MRLLGVALALAAFTSLAAADTTVPGGNVINQTWTMAGSPYIVQGDIIVPAGATLTIQAGTTVRFASSDSQAANTDTARVELIVRGTLTINGTAAQPVSFVGQSAANGSWYGIVIDTPATGSAFTAANLAMTGPAVGILHKSTMATVSTDAITINGIGNTGIRVEAGSPTYHGVSVAGGSVGFDITSAGSATLTSCSARNATNAGARLVSTSARSLSLSKCTFHSNGSYGVYSGASGGSSVTVTDSIITDSTYGAYRNDASSFSVTYSTVWGNNSAFVGGVTSSNITVANPLYVSSSNLRLTSNSPARFAAQGNADQGAFPYTTDATVGLLGTLWTNTTFTAAGSPYTVSGDLGVGPGVTLTIQPGAVVTFSSSDQMASGVDTARTELLIRGTVIAQGTAASTITLAGASVSPGSWGGIVIEPAAMGTALTLHHATVTSPSIGILHRSTTATASTLAVNMSVGNTGVRVEAGAPTYNGIATAGGSVGFDITSAGSATLTNCVARNATNAGARLVSTSARTLSITNCTFHSNGSYGVYSGASGGSSITVHNSIITDSTYGAYRNDASSFSVTYSDVWGNNSQFVGGVTSSNVISQNPNYVSTTDLQLQSNSIAIDAASATGAPTSDQRGVTRPLDGDGINGAQYDMGAYEYVAVQQCGNGAVEGTEVCDSGAMNGMYGFCNANCSAQGPRCGDNMTNGPETCDDGNTVDTDGCRNNCILAACGDGVVQAGVEACDDGNIIDTDGCTADCKLASCGDGVVQAGVEACDDGNEVDTDACHDCVVAICGDGIVRAGVEACDDGNQVDDDGCNNQCVSSTCGDGVVQAPHEQCDDGNDIDTDECRNACIDPICGDNIRQPDEQCDDGNMDAGDGCSPECRYEAGPGNPDGGMQGEEEEGDEAGGCCSTSSGGATGLLSALALMVTLRRRRSTRR